VTNKNLKNKHMKKSIIPLLILILSLLVVSAQDREGNFEHPIYYKKNYSQKNSRNPINTKTYIVQFEEECFIKTKLHISFYLSRKMEFQNDLYNLNSAKGRSINNIIEIEDFYYKSFFGASIISNEKTVEEIRKLAYVKTITEDHTRKVNLSESLELHHIP